MIKVQVRCNKNILELTKLHSTCLVKNFKSGRIAWIKRGQIGTGAQSAKCFVLLQSHVLNSRVYTKPGLAHWLAQILCTPPIPQLWTATEWFIFPPFLCCLHLFTPNSDQNLIFLMIALCKESIPPSKFFQLLIWIACYISEVC